jgi:hypothetical protein
MLTPCQEADGLRAELEDSRQRQDQLMVQLQSERQDRSHWAKQRLSLLSQFCHEENQLHNTISNVNVSNESMGGGASAAANAYAATTNAYATNAYAATHAAEQSHWQSQQQVLNRSTAPNAAPNARSGNGNGNGTGGVGGASNNDMQTSDMQVGAPIGASIGMIPASTMPTSSAMPVASSSNFFGGSPTRTNGAATNGYGSSDFAHQGYSAERQTDLFSAVGRRHQQIAAEQLRAELQRPYDA